MFTLDIDVGGTFTDGFFTSGSSAWRAKVATTPHDLSVGILDCVCAGAELAGLDSEGLLRQVDVARVSTTVGTNTLLQKNGPQVGVLVQSGHGADLYGAAAQLAGIVSPELVREVDLPLDPLVVLAALRELLGLGARILAVSLPDPAAEAGIRSLAQERYPEHYLRRVVLQGSWELSDVPDDRVRTATVVLNAYLHPVMVRNLYKVEDQLRARGLRRPLLVVHNSGGVARVAKTVALNTYSSGPVAGLFGAAYLAGLNGWEQLLTLDVGGTSSDIGSVQGGRVVRPTAADVEGVGVALPMYRTRSVGVAGGSLAHVDGGTVEVGPQSAGSVPGPACYGRGGDRPTVTDADLVLGFLAPGSFLGGRQVLDVERARAAIEREVAKPLGISVEQAAERIRDAADEQIARSIGVAVQDARTAPEALALLAFGGAGPVHACDVARRVGVRRVAVVPFGSVFNAFGASTMDVAHLYARRLDDLDEQALLDELRTAAETDMRGEGFIPAETEYAVERTGGRAILLARAPVPHWAPEPRPAAATRAAAPANRPLYRRGEWHEAGIFSHADLLPGAVLDGSAVIEYEDSSLVVPRGWRCSLDGVGNAIVEWEGGA